jgi:hypothetical protein
VSAPALPACPAATSTTAPVDKASSDEGKRTATGDSKASGGVDDVHGIKATGTVTAVAGHRVTVAVEGDTPGERTSVTLLVDEATTRQGVATQLSVGQTVGFAAAAGPDGTSHALAISVDAAMGAGATAKDPGATGSQDPPTDPNLRKSTATVVAVDATTLTINVHDGPDAGQQRQMSLAGVTYTATHTTCAPAAPLEAGDEIGLVYSDIDGQLAALTIILG